MLHSQDVSLAASNQYMHEVGWIPQLTSEEEAELLSCLEHGVNVQRARERLIEGYQSLVIGLAKRFARHCRCMEFLDLVQEGNVGLLQALQKYDGSKSMSSFGTFAFSWIRTVMLTAIWQYDGAIRFPLHKARAIRRMSGINARLFSELGREPMVGETAQAMGMTERDVRELQVLQELQIVSLDMPVDENGEVFLGETLEDTTVSAFTHEELSVLEDGVLQYLTEQERAVIVVRYGADDGQCCTQREVAQRLGMKLNKVQKIDSHARLRLRRILERQAC